MVTVQAILIGIDKYDGFPHLSNAVSDAKKVADVLAKKYGVKPTSWTDDSDTTGETTPVTDAGKTKGEITLLTDSLATKGNVAKAISSLTKKAKRNDTIIFYFSGYAGKARVEAESDSDGAGAGNATVGIICPVDAKNNGGISDKFLLQSFDQVSKSCGNNITLLLDCVGRAFTWNSPTSCVIVAPDRSNESEEGGTFTQAVLKVLRNQSYETMTVESFAGHVQAEMDDVKVHCVGSNINRSLFNLNGGQRGHHAFIPGRTLKDGRILLCAGVAHGVCLQAVYGIYSSNLVSGSNTKLGELYVHALNNDNITATLRSKDSDRFIPPFFYAIEELDYFKPLKIFVPEPSDLLNLLSGWDPVDGESKAHVTLRVENGLRFMWNGVAMDLNSARQFMIPAFPGRDPSRSVQRAIRRGARFCHYLDEPSPDRSSVSKIRVQLHLVDDSYKPTGDNLIIKDDFVKLKLTEESLDVYSLTIFNDNTVPVWPHVFIYDPEGFEISPLYLPPLGTLVPPLARNSSLIIGGQENGRRLMLEYIEDKKCAFLYLKVFITQERTDFRFIQQWYYSPTEDNLRGYAREKKKGDDVGKPESDEDLALPIEDVQSPTEEVESRKKINLAKWYSKCITIFQEFEAEHDSKEV